MKNKYINKRILITGGNGFLGRHLVQKLKNSGYKNIYVVERENYDLTIVDDIKRMYKDQQPDIVIHLAASVGGIGANMKNPAKFFYENSVMGIHTMHEGFLNKIDKFVFIGTICSYPKNCKVPFKESDLWAGYPEETNAPYGLAKKMGLVQSMAYRDQYDFNSIYLLPVNLYGPGDNFSDETSHVIPALIKKCINAVKNNLDNIEVWGTGKATREFCYVEDTAEGIILAMEKYNESNPINIGAGFEISIKDLVYLIAKYTEFHGNIIWNKDKPDGQPRRMLNTDLAKKHFGFKAKTKFEIGLRKTINWYKNNTIN
tara:strand:- start:1176 stop:2120 length:945 start_codon:yes stop_codon:yes gene_type:complete